MRFLDLELSDKVLNNKTILLFCETLIQARVVEKLFEQLGEKLEGKGYIGKEGKIVDTSLVEGSARQRNNRK